MDRIELIEERLKLLSKIVRGVLSAILILSLLRTVSLLSKVGHFQQIFEDILKGQPMPKLTELICYNGPLLTSITLVVGVFSLFAAYKKKNESWPLILLASISVGLMIFHQVLFWALVQPILKIIENLGG